MRMSDVVSVKPPQTLTQVTAVFRDPRGPISAVNWDFVG